MSSANTALEIESNEATPAVDKPAVLPPAAVLRGSARGLEIVIDGKATLDAIAGAVSTRLAEAPAFFKGSDVRIRVEDGPLPVGSLARLDELAGQFDLRIVEVGAAQPVRTKAPTAAASEGNNAIPVPSLAAGTAPNDFDDVPTESRGLALGEFDDTPTKVGVAPPAPNAIVMATAEALAPALSHKRFEAALASARVGLSWVAPPPGAPAQPSLPLIELPARPASGKPAPELPRAEPPTADQLELALRALEPEIEVIPATRIVIGPVRSGVILDHVGHLIVFGDVNPGAEVRAAGNIVVLGRLRGTAHAGIGTDVGFILALRLQPQQLRIGRLVARASDSDTPDQFPEIAHVAPVREGAPAIVVERYQGRLPNGLAASL
jgi:septum formation inhibitor MinC